MPEKRSLLAPLALVLLASFLVLAQEEQRGGQQGRPQPQHHPMSFFVTSVGLGKGGDLGGLAGADAHCLALATAVGAGNHTWHAYLSTQARPGQPAVNARDRIGTGPWYNTSRSQLGHAYTVKADHTCNNWTSSGAGSAQVGHSDRIGNDNASWNSSHATTGCSQAALESTGGSGLFYCFAVN